MLTLVQGWGNKAVGTETQDERKDGLWLAYDNYTKVLSRRRHAHSRKGSVTAVWTECAKMALDICQPTERDLE